MGGREGHEHGQDKPARSRDVAVSVCVFVCVCRSKQLQVHVVSKAPARCQPPKGSRVKAGVQLECNYKL